VLPATHHLFIEEAVFRVGSFAQENLASLLSGNDDEDVHIVPILGFRLRAAGFTHTYRPGKRFGELFFPSAKDRCRVYMEAAKENRNIERSAYFLGRACHVLGDAAVPARANGVWHLEGDPLEAWIEARVESFRGVELPLFSASSPGEIIEELASLAARLRADTTRTPWGRFSHHYLGRGVLLEEKELEAQARVIVPAAIAATVALLRANKAA